MVSNCYSGEYILSTLLGGSVFIAHDLENLLSLSCPEWRYSPALEYFYYISDFWEWQQGFERVFQLVLGFPGGPSGKEPALQCRRQKRRQFNPWVGKTPWRRAWQPTPVFLPGESPWRKETGGLQSMGSQHIRKHYKLIVLDVAP